MSQTHTYACGITTHRPTGDLFEILGLGDPLLLEGDWWSVQSRFSLEEIENFTPDQHYAWKALSDPDYYRLYLEHRSTEVLARAGFFDDGLNKLVSDFKVYDVQKFPTIPLQKVKNNTVDGEEKVAILLTTGGMSPIHRGHIEMMEKAREIAKSQGYHVVGGFITPGHDSYVGSKYGGTAAIHAEHRIKMVELATRDSDWLACNPWPARYLPVEINFTDVIRHIQNAVPPGIEVIYVHGSDNPDFGLAVHSISVDRSEISSSAVRDGHLDYLDPVVREYYENIGKISGDTRPYLIRDDAFLSMDYLLNNSAWISKFGMHSEEDLRNKITQFQSSLRLGIASLFKAQGEYHPIHFLDVKEQIKEARVKVDNRPSISLDPFYPGDFYYGTTRFFEFSGPQARPEFRAQRPGLRDLVEQIDEIYPGEYVLVEDDIVTGSTIASFMALLPKDVTITDVVVLSDFGPHRGVEYFDIVDLRDFIFGTKDGGLGVVNYFGTPLRALYAAPFVNLHSRAKIPVESQIDLSRIIWQANHRFYKDTGLTVSDAPWWIRRWAICNYWKMEDRIEDIMKFYVDALLESVSA